VEIPYYGCFYWGIMQQFDLTPTEALVATLVKQLSKRTGDCYMAKATIARQINVKEDTVYRAINKLIEKGVLDRSNQGTYRPSKLRVTDAFDQAILEANKKIEEMKSGKKY